MQMMLMGAELGMMGRDLPSAVSMARAIVAALWKVSVPCVRTYCEKLRSAVLSPIGTTTEACSLSQ